MDDCMVGGPATPERRAEIERLLRDARGTGWLILPIGSPSFSVIDTGPVEPQPDIVFDAGAVVPYRVVEIYSLSAPPSPTEDCPPVGERPQKLSTKDIPDAEILDAVHAFHSGGGPTPEVALAGKYPPKVVLAKMQRLVDRGILDYGVSLHSAWIANEPGG